jgi:hypothetical protein
MKQFRLRLSSILWLVAIAAAFLAGIRYGEHRAAARRGGVVRSLQIQVNGGRNPTTILHAGP